MCGIFGTIRPQRYRLRHPATEALLTVGEFAEERGTDSSGLAIFDGHGKPASRRHSTAAPLVDLVDGRWRQVLSQTRFGADLHAWPRVTTDVRRASIVLGHTRWATQGDVSLRNASPVRIGAIIGTHNGDVATPDGWPIDRTDTAYLYRQLGKASNASQITAVLAGLRGRAALAWARIDQPGHVHLARTALSPLWLAQDAGRAIWWASNPEWLREVGAFYGLGLGRAVPLHEGSYRVLRSARDEVRGVEGASFVATSRRSDERIASYAAWRGFSDRDVAAELRIVDHDVETARWQAFGVAR